MGPYPHDAPPPTISPENPMGTDGFEFVEYTAPDTTLLRDLFTKMGFPAVARHKRKDVTLHRQGNPHPARPIRIGCGTDIGR